MPEGALRLAWLDDSELFAYYLDASLDLVADRCDPLHV
jgi:hypothetical protein